MDLPFFKFKMLLFFLKEDDFFFVLLCQTTTFWQLTIITYHATRLPTTNLLDSK